tara:strand:+ start:1992 stop:2756 length:765 start_codon:yes stop_codon:yes gene_type:complete
MHHLIDREILEIAGIDAISFLQNLITNDLMNIQEKKIIHTFLLNNKGKILFEFYIHEIEGRFLIDVNSDAIEALMSHLKAYKLRSNIVISIQDKYAVYWINSDSDYPTDPRNEKIGIRRVIKKDQITEYNIKDNYDNIRINQSIAELNKDFKSGDIFPHELASHDNSISRKKGCYPGQEIISRVYHNKVISKKEFVRFACSGTLKSQGTKLLLNGKEIGFLGSSADGVCLAYVNRELKPDYYEVVDDKLIDISL